jgi:hypothetical protein
MAPPRAGRFVISLLLASASPSFAFAFAPPSTSSCRAEGARLLRSRALVDPSAAHEVVSWLHHAGGDFHLLADAAAVPADAAEVAKDAGWWDTYIGAFKTTIKGVDDFYRSNGVPGSFGWSIVTFTALIKTGLLPFQYFQLFSSERMKNLQPVQKQIKERYGNDKAREQYVVSKLFEQVSLVQGTEGDPLLPNSRPNIHSHAADKNEPRGWLHPLAAANPHLHWPLSISARACFRQRRE